MVRAYIALGSNMGDRWARLSEACERLASLAASAAVRVSAVYETAPVGGPAEQGAFLNAVVVLETSLKPGELIERMQAIERQAGRPARNEREHWGPRPLDLDLLMYDEQVIDQPGLSVPHPRLQERWFVLQPLADVAPDLEHPRLEATVAELLAKVTPDHTTVRHSADPLLAAAGLK